MVSNPFHRAIYLTGPTASGKTAVGVALAERLEAEVIALDSMTLYRGLDVGTAKPTVAEQRGIRHHLIDVLDPWESASVADYRGWALDVLLDVESRGKRVLFVGGTVLYMKALLRGLFKGPGAIPELRHSLEAEAAERGDSVLHARLARLDPATAGRLHPHDRRRVIRALEVITMTGRPLSELQTDHARAAPPDIPVFALTRSPEELKTRIARRVVQMFSSGFVEEVRKLLYAPNPLGPVPAQSVGYREVIEFLYSRATFPETVARIEKRTRRFAKHQATWFRGLAEVRPWDVNAGELPEITAQRLASQIELAN
jgi:tRNA dimethylallyltransferase